MEFKNKVIGTVLFCVTLFFIGYALFVMLAHAQIPKDVICAPHNFTYEQCDEFYNQIYKDVIISNITNNVTKNYTVINNITEIRVITNNITEVVENNITQAMTNNITQIQIINTSGTYTKVEIDAMLREKEDYYNLSKQLMQQKYEYQLSIYNYTVNQKPPKDEDPFSFIIPLMLKKALGIEEAAPASPAQSQELVDLQQQVYAMQRQNKSQEGTFPYTLIIAALILGAIAYYYLGPQKKSSLQGANTFKKMQQERPAAQNQEPLKVVSEQTPLQPVQERRFVA